MKIVSRSFLAQKDGESFDDCQDGVFPEPGKGGTQHFAVTDGATSSFFPRPWAQILARRFGADAEGAFENWGAWIAVAQREWLDVVERACKAPGASIFAANEFAARKPAAATLAGLQFRRGTQGLAWRALVVGDSCLFRLRADGIVHSYRLRRSDDFIAVTEAIESRPGIKPVLPTLVPAANEEVLEGDVFLLATDALAKWLLSRAEHGEPEWATLLEVRTGSDFIRWIEAARKRGQPVMGNDDVTLVIACAGTPAPCWTRQRRSGRKQVEALDSGEQRQPARAGAPIWTIAVAALFFTAVMALIVLEWLRTRNSLTTLQAERSVIIHENAQLKVELSRMAKERASQEREITELRARTSEVSRTPSATPDPGPPQAREPAKSGPGGNGQ